MTAASRPETRAASCDCGTCCDQCGHDPGCMALLLSAAEHDAADFDAAFADYRLARGFSRRPGLSF